MNITFICTQNYRRKQFWDFFWVIHGKSEDFFISLGSIMSLRISSSNVGSNINCLNYPTVDYGSNQNQESENSHPFNLIELRNRKKGYDDDIERPINLKKNSLYLRARTLLHCLPVHVYNSVSKLMNYSKNPQAELYNKIFSQ
jgi:hypothetical protein